MDISDFIDLDPIPLGHESKQLCLSEFVDIEDFTCDLASSEYNFDNSLVDQMPLNTIMPTPTALITGFIESPLLIEDELVSSSKKEKKREERSCSSKKALEFENIKKHFGFPINEAAKKMKVGLTSLKRRCRELNIMRWPYRKIKSLNTLISNVKEMGLTKEVATLEQQKMVVEEVLPDMKLDKDTKKLRQACFKANHKKRKSLALQA